MKKAIFTIFASMAAVFSVTAAPLPPDILKQIKNRLPAAFVPAPKSNAGKISPLVSDKRRTPDRRYAITIDGSPFAITDISEDAALVQMSVPAGYRTAAFTKRWFKTEDVFGRIDWDLNLYEPAVPCLAYFGRGKGQMELVAKIPARSRCASLGTVASRKEKFRLVQTRQPYRASGEEVAFMLVFTRENPPVNTQDEYDARAAQLTAEYAYRHGRPWGKAAPSILGNTYATECAAIAADFVTYMFDVKIKAGERFEDVAEIRTGDVVYMKGHYFAVLYRNKDRLTTIEGNMNATVHQSSKRYSVKNGKLMCGGQDVEFQYGYHYWKPRTGKKEP